jgi:hypothetical protein
MGRLGIRGIESTLSQESGPERNHELGRSIAQSEEYNRVSEQAGEHLSDTGT